jgi:hypothetical protein
MTSMGYYKNKYIEESERGWASVGEKYVCCDCLDDYALKDFIRDNAVSRVCSYCGRRSKRRLIAAHADDVIEQINEGITTEWGHPDDEGVIYDHEDGDYIIPTIYTNDLFYEISPINNSDFLNDVIDAYSAYDSLWCRKPAFSLSHDQILQYGWDNFAKAVKHDVRYFFLKKERSKKYSNNEEILPSDFLKILAGIIKEIDLVKKLPKNTLFYRARVHKTNLKLNSAKDLGTPPTDSAIYSNRMSPSGIPMFYGACEKLTAIIEVGHPTINKNKMVSVGTFIAARELRLLDLSSLPKIPSLFDSTKNHIRHYLIFLHDFVNELAKQIIKDGHEHIEYVPTQVVTEYFLKIFRTEDRKQLNGILYKSSLKKGGICCVLFFKNDNCIDIHPGWKSEKDYLDKPMYWLGLEQAKIKTFSRLKVNTLLEKEENRGA